MGNGERGIGNRIWVYLIRLENCYDLFKIILKLKTSSHDRWVRPSSVIDRKFWEIASNDSKSIELSQLKMRVSRFISQFLKIELSSDEWTVRF